MYFLVINTVVNNTQYYCVSFSSRTKTNFKDCTIAKYIGLKTKQYREILIGFRALIFDKECYFEFESDCEKCCKYLQELYRPIIKLAESF